MELTWIHQKSIEGGRGEVEDAGRGIAQVDPA
jgi:hypothetical protein